MKLYEPFRHWKTFLIQDGVQDGGQKCYLHEMDPYNTRIISKLLFYGQVIVRINEMRHFVIGQVFRYNMASKMATKIVYLNESNTKYTPVVYELRLRSQIGNQIVYSLEHSITTYQFDVSLNDK